MKRWILTTLYSLGILVSIGVVLNYLILPVLLIRLLKDQWLGPISAELQMKTSIQSAQMNAAFPFHIILKGVAAENAQERFEISQLDLSISPSFQSQKIKLHTKVVIQQPLVQLTDGNVVGSKKPQAPVESEGDLMQVLPQDFLGFPLHQSFQFEISDGEVTFQVDKSLDRYTLQDVQLQFHHSNLLNKNLFGTLKFNAKSDFEFQGIQLQMPMSLSSHQVQLNSHLVKVGEMSFSAAGIQTQINGYSEFSTGQHNWQLRLSVNELEKLPVPAQFLPQGQWQGGLWGQIHLTKNSNRPLKVISQFQSRNLKGILAINESEFRALGPLDGEIRWQVKYENSVLSAPEIELKLRADDLLLEKKNLLSKPAGAPMNLSVSGYISKNVFVMKDFLFRLAQVNLKSKGYIGLKESIESQFSLSIPRTGLRGLEKIFPILDQKMPVQGVLSAKAKVKGGLFSGIENLSFQVNPLRLQKFYTNFNLRDDVKKIYLIGPVRGDMAVSLNTRGKKIGKTTVRGNVDFTQVEAYYKGLFSKKMGVPLRLNLNIGNQGENLTTSGSTVYLGSGSLAVKGTLSGFNDPKLQMQWVPNKFPIGETLKLMGLYSRYSLDGTVSGSMGLTGQYFVEKGFPQSPLRAYGSLNIFLNKFEMEKTSLQKLAAGKPLAAEPSMPILPKWPLFELSRLDLAGNLRHFQYKGLPIKGIKWKAKYTKGFVSATATLRSLFGGSAVLRRFKMPLLQKNPVVDGLLSFQEFNIKQILGFASPNYQKEAAGIFSGQVDMKTHLPKSQNFTAGLKGLVQLQTKNMYIRSLKLEEKVNQSLKKIPKLKVSKVKTGAFRGRANAVGRIEGAALKLSQFQLTSSKNDLFQLQGSVSLLGDLNLFGSMSLQKPPVRGDVYSCNQDSQGRFVLPIILKGKWNEPSFDFASNTLERLTKKTLKCQATRQKQMVRRKVKQQAEKKQKQLTDQIEQEADKVLKDLFN